IPGNFTVPTGMVPVPGQNAVYLADEQGSFNSPPPLGRIWRIDFNSGAQTIVSQNGSQGSLFNHPVDITTSGGFIYVANTGSNPDVAGSVFRVDPQNGGVQSLVTTFGAFSGTDSIEVGTNGMLYVGQIAGGSAPGAVIQVNPSGGGQQTLTSDGLLSL